VVTEKGQDCIFKRNSKWKFIRYGLHGIPEVRILQSPPALRRATDKPPETIGLLVSPGFAKAFEEMPPFNAIRTAF
jgi:hypothetical protein